MTTITTPRAEQPRRTVVLAAAIAGIAGVALGATLVLTVPRLTQHGAQAAQVTKQTVSVPQGGGLPGTAFRQQVPPAARAWVQSLSSAYRPGGSTYDQQVPYAARHPANATAVSPGSTYNQQVPAFQ